MSGILICGSRNRTRAMQDYAMRCVARAKENGDSIIVGDAHGIDEDVVTACYRLGVPYMCYGIAPEPRNGAPTYTNTQLASYAERDKHMVGLADKVMCIWNGDSKGTLDVFHHTCQVGKQTWLAIFIEWFGKEEFRLKEGDTDFSSTLQFADDNERQEFFSRWKADILAQMNR